MFKNLMLYRIVSPWTATVAGLEQALQQAQFVACSGAQEKSVGWTGPRGVAHGPLLEVVGGQWLMQLMTEVKIIPASVVKRHADARLQEIEASTGRKPGKKETRDLREDARLALLPLAFTKQASTLVWVDPQAQRLVLDTASQATADAVLTSLVKAVDGLAVQLVDTQTSPAVAMAHWLATQEAPVGFTVDRECELKAADESKAVVRYTRHALDTEEVAQHIAMGKMPTRLALTWNDHVSFVLTQALQLKKVALLDVVLEASATLASDRQDDHFDADVALVTGELQKLLPELVEALGGEKPLPLQG